MPRLSTRIGTVVAALLGRLRRAPSAADGGAPGTRSALAPWVLPTLVAVIFQIVLMGTYAARFKGEVSVFVCAGSARMSDGMLDHVRVTPSKGGHDGQFYYVIARSPWQKQDPRFVDVCGYRHIRILYPVLAWMFSAGGDPAALIWVMPALNVLAIGAAAGLGAYFARRSGRSEWWGVLVPLLLSAATPALRNLTDPFAITAALGLLIAWRSKWNAAALVLFAAAAVFSRETNVALVGIVLLAAIWSRDWVRASGLAVVLAAWCLWVAHLWTLYGEAPFLTGNFGYPFEGFLKRFHKYRTGAWNLRAAVPSVGLLNVMALVAVAAAMPLLRANRVLAVTAGLGAVMAVCGSYSIYEDWFSYSRVFTFLPLGILLWAIESGRRWPLLLLSPAILWLIPTFTEAWELKPMYFPLTP